MSSSLPPVSRHHCLALAATATCFIWGGSILDGSLFLLLKAVFSDKYILPGTQSALRKSFTGIYWPIDLLLDVLVVFFWEAVDGSHPAASALGLYFISQYLPVLTCFYTDAARAGNKSSLKIDLSVWLLLFQACSIGAAGPFFALSYMQLSPSVGASTLEHLQEASVAPVLSLGSLPIALGLGYLLPTLMMSLKSPDITSNQFQQKAIALWNVFPIWVLCIQKILDHVLPIVLHKLNVTLRQDDKTVRMMHLQAIRIVNAIMAFIGTAAHITFVAVAWSTVLLPAIWAPGMAEQLSPRSLFIPPLPFYPHSWANTVGDGVRSFFMWDMIFGFVVSLLMAYVQFKTAAASRAMGVRDRVAIPVLLLGSLAVGPGTTCLLTSWARDELVFDGASATQGGIKDGSKNGAYVSGVQS